MVFVVLPAKGFSQKEIFIHTVPYTLLVLFSVCPRSANAASALYTATVFGVAVCLLAGNNFPEKVPIRLPPLLLVS